MAINVEQRQEKGKVGRPTRNGRHGCTPVPYFDRIKYFHGQMLGHRDFQREQDFFREKMKLHNRCLHGYGVVCGLEVEVIQEREECPPPRDSEIDRQIEELEGQQGRIGEQISELESSEREADERTVASLREEYTAVERRLDDWRRRQPSGEAEWRHTLVIHCGLALDCEGDELVVRDSLCAEIEALLSDEDRRRLHAEDGPHTLYVSICYREQLIEPVRAALAEACGGLRSCRYSKLRDAVCIHVALQKPEEDERCDSCCEPCCDPCLLLAEIRNYVPRRRVDTDDVRNDVRRPVSTYHLTTISGISWAHGATYSFDEVDRIMKEGVVIKFSRPVLAETLDDGVVDLLLFQGGRQLSGNVAFLQGFIDKSAASGDLIDRIHFKIPHAERLDEGDRVHVIVRTNFILDKCCRPVDGEHVGGWVPLLSDDEHNQPGGPPEPCIELRGRHGPWSSGNGVAGGTFESWFFVGRRPTEVIK